MRLILFAACLATLAACTSATPTAPAFTAVTDADALKRGETAYGVRCMGCHEPATPGAPNRAALSAMTPAHIYSALTVGKMKLMAIDLPEQDAREIASYLGKK
ncbi:MAG TPA: c-type cytochrome [Hyphomonadaceae bacterium]|jgi:mono/diheme cytochrome c family protein|nr:c-type cytochrome [Hyphomonadaceae bacterium]